MYALSYLLFDVIYIYHAILHYVHLYCSKKTVVVSLWNDLATNVGQELLDIAEQSPVVAIKSVKVGEFQGT